MSRFFILISVVFSLLSVAGCASGPSGPECPRTLSFPDYFDCYKQRYAATHGNLPEYAYLMGNGALIAEQVRTKKITNATAYGLWDIKRSEANTGIENRNSAQMAAWGNSLQGAGAALSAAGAPPATNIYVQQAPRTCYRNGNYINCY